MAIRRETDLASVPLVPAQRDLSLMLEREAAMLGSEWRKRYYANDTALTEVAQLEGVIDSLIAELAHSVSQTRDLPSAAWGRAGGVLRLSRERGAPGLHQEFALLRGVLETAGLATYAPFSQRKRLRILLDAAEAQALALLAHTQAPDGGLGYPSARFGGVVVETP